MPEKKPLAKRRKRKRKSDLLTAVEQENRDRAFASAYIKAMDPTVAAKAIGLDLTTPTTAWNYLHRPSVQEIIKDEMDKRTDAAGITEARIINELAALAFSSVKDFVVFSGHDVTLVNSGTLTRDQAASIQSVQSKQSKVGPPTVSIKMYDKLKALELLMRCKGMISTDGRSAIDANDARQFAEAARSAAKEMDDRTSPGKDGSG